MMPTRIANIVSCLCLIFCLLCLVTSVFFIATGGIGRAMIPVAFVALIFRVDLWFRRKQQARERKPVSPDGDAGGTEPLLIRLVAPPQK